VHLPADALRVLQEAGSAPVEMEDVPAG
jgi:hypothetical protein